MDLQTKLKPYVGGQIMIKDQVLTLESVEEDHLVLMDEDSLHSFIQLTSVKEVQEVPGEIPKIILK